MSRRCPTMSSQSYLDRKTGADGYGRFAYLQALVTEFQDSDSASSRKEVLANLANFAYDPINYEHLRRLHVVDLFMDMLSEDDEDLLEFGVSGICNVCLDPASAKRIDENGGISSLIACLSSSREEIVLSAITALLYLLGPARRARIATELVIDCMERFAGCSNVRLRNVAAVFLEECQKKTWCTNHGGISFVFRQHDGLEASSVQGSFWLHWRLHKQAYPWRACLSRRFRFREAGGEWFPNFSGMFWERAPYRNLLTQIRSTGLVKKIISLGWKMWQTVHQSWLFGNFVAFSFQDYLTVPVGSFYRRLGTPEKLALPVLDRAHGVAGTKQWDTLQCHSALCCGCLLLIQCYVSLRKFTFKVDALQELTSSRPSPSD